MATREKDYIIIFLTVIILFGAGFLAFGQFDKKEVIDLTDETLIEVETEVENADEDIKEEVDSEDSEDTNDEDEDTASKTYTSTTKSAKALVEKYYDLIVQQDLDSAFDLKRSSSVNFETFQSWYEDIEDVSIKNFKKDEDNIYTYDVSMYGEKDGFEKFTVKIKVYDDEFTTLSSVRTSEKKVDPKDLTIKIKDKEMIETYYHLIAYQKLSEAYAMKVNESESLATFRNWYDGTFTARVNDLKRIDDDIYTYEVNLLGNDGDERYSVKVKIHGDKFETLSSTKISSQQNDECINYSDNLKAKIVWEPNRKAVILIKNGREIVVDEVAVSTSEFSIANRYKNLSFVQNGKYLKYEVSGWEQFEIRLFDISAERKLSVTASNELSFTSDGQYLYACTTSGMREGGVDVYVMPSLRRIYSDRQLINSCNSFYPSTGRFDYTIYNYNTDSEDYIYKNVYDL